jgi:hypothetical protein
MRHRLYQVHYNMMRRCYNSKCHAWPNYGGRGIRVAAIFHDYGRFREWFEWAFGTEDIPKGLTWDRINNEGDYTPINVRLATMKQQENNKRSNRQLTWKGQTKTLSEWSDETGLTSPCIVGRLGMGWTIDKALGTPTQKPRTYTVEGFTGTLAEIATRLKVPKETLQGRVRKGLPLLGPIVVGQRYTAGNCTGTIRELSAHLGIKEATLRRRLRKGQPLDMPVDERKQGRLHTSQP